MARQRRRRSRPSASPRDPALTAALEATPMTDENSSDNSDMSEENDEEEGASNSYGPGNSDIRQKLNPLDETEFQNRVAIGVQAAETYIDTLITPARVQAAEYYRAAPFGDEEQGRSQVVLSEVRDTIQSIMPSLMRIFTSGQRIVEYLSLIHI